MSVPVPQGTVLLDKGTVPPADEDAMDEVFRDFKKRCAKDPMHLKRVKISTLAAIKMIVHANSGVVQGRKDDSNANMPVEVMGNMMGYIDPLDPECLIITDSFITPCIGGAHAAVQDARTGGYRSEFEELYKLTNSKVMQCGWYHSHPFEPKEAGCKGGGHHCWFSATDVNTQTGAQGTYDRTYGAPYVGIVIDPQTTLKKRKLHFGCFRTYNRVQEGERGSRLKVPKGRTPDGVALPGHEANVARWGDQWDKYYALEVTFYTNKETSKTLRILNAAYGWINDLVSSEAMDLQYKMDLNASAAEFGVDSESVKLQMEHGKKQFVQQSGRGGSKGRHQRGAQAGAAKESEEQSAFESLVKRTAAIGVEVAVVETKLVAASMLA